MSCTWGQPPNPPEHQPSHLQSGVNSTTAGCTERGKHVRKRPAPSVLPPTPAPVNPQQMPSPPVSCWPAQPWPGIPGRCPGSSQHVATKEPRAGRAACGPSLHPAVQSCRGTGTREGPAETEQTKIASFLLVPLDLAGCVGDPGASGACRVRADSEQLAQPLGRGQPRAVTSPPAASSASWTETGHPSRAKLPLTSKPLHRLIPMADLSLLTCPSPLV